MLFRSITFTISCPGRFRLSILLFSLICMFKTKFIQDIVKVILNNLNYPSSIDTKELIGIKSRVKKLKSHSTIESNDIRIIGIWGTKGIGETTFARVINGMVSNKFEAFSFNS